MLVAVKKGGKLVCSFSRKLFSVGLAFAVLNLWAARRQCVVPIVPEKSLHSFYTLLLSFSTGLMGRSSTVDN